jgi:hypothetical protein
LMSRQASNHHIGASNVLARCPVIQIASRMIHGHTDGNVSADEMRCPCPVQPLICSACDLCFRKKIKCDMLLPVCSNCILYKSDCRTSLVRHRAGRQTKQTRASDKTASTELKPWVLITRLLSVPNGQALTDKTEMNQLMI